MKTIKLFIITTIFMVVNAFGITIIDTNVTYTSDMTFMSNLIVTSDGVLTVEDCNLKFFDNIGITILSGGQLILDGAVLTSLDPTSYKWRGIKSFDTWTVLANPSGNTIQASDSRISHSIKGIYNANLYPINPTQGRGMSIRNCVFVDNDIHINLSYLSSNIEAVDNHLIFENNVFEGRVKRDEIFISNGSNIYISNNEFNSSSAELNGFSVVFENSLNFEIISNYFDNNTQSTIGLSGFVKNGAIDNNSFILSPIVLNDISATTDRAIYISNNIRDNQNFEFSEIQDLQIQNNKFFSQIAYELGIVIEKQFIHGVQISDNTFSKINRAIWSEDIMTNSDHNFSLMNNSFQDYFRAIGFINGSSFLATCNIFNSGDEAVYYHSLTNSGSQIGFDHSNKFMGSQYDIVQDGPNPFIYGITNNTTSPNIPTNNIGDVQFQLEEPGGFRCGKVSPKLVDENELTELIYENGWIEILNLKSGTQITIHNAIGQRVYEGESFGSQERIDIHNYTSGIYFVMMENQGEYKSIKFVK